jgi:UDP-N-acetylmuramate--alanine ligase
VPDPGREPDWTGGAPGRLSAPAATTGPDVRLPPAADRGPVDQRDGTAPDLSRMRKVHIVGIGGAGMSAIATVLLAMGHRVTGSDAAPSDRLRNLALAGAEVHVGHDPHWLRDADVVAVSTAIPPANAEVAEAGRRGLRVWRRAELLAAICRERRTVAIAGTHGKTTTSAMLAVILRHAGARPSYIVGGDLMGTTPGAAWEPGGEWLVVEADESDGTFLELGAEAVVVTSVEPDHLDFYGDIATLREAFLRFAAAAPGPRVLCADEPGARALAASLDPPGPGATGTAAPGAVTTYGTGSNATIRIEDVALGTAGAAFSLRTAGRRVATVWLRVPGLHNVRNAAAALTMAEALGVPWAEGAAALRPYLGVARRLERRGERDGVTYVDDYGHLPGEVTSVLAAVAGRWDRVVAVFQPHRYSRTEALWPDFADAFGKADVVIVTDIYPAGESPRPGITGRLIADAVERAHPAMELHYAPTLDDAAAVLARILRPGDLCLTLGAGDLTTLPDRFLGSPDRQGSLDRQSSLDPRGEGEAR